MVHVDMARGESVALSCVGGDVTLDRTSDVRASFKATLVDPTHTLTPSAANDVLLPLINEVVIRRGVVTAAGEENFQLGVFGISHADVAESDGQTVIELDGLDRSDRVRRELEVPFSFAQGTAWDRVIRGLVQQQYPTATFAANWPSDTTQVASALAYDAGTDAWAECLNAAGALGKDLYVNDLGAFTLKTIPSDYIGTPVWDYVEGSGCTQVDTSKGYTSDTVFNGVVVTSVSGDIRGEAWDDDPASKTSRPNIGARATTITRNVGSTSQADAMARSELVRLMASYEEVTFTALPNPALEVGDLVHYVNRRLSIDGNFIVNRISFPLGLLDLMEVTIAGHSSRAGLTFTQGTSDTQAPSVPQNLVVQSFSVSHIEIGWDASTDNVGVAGYNVYRDGVNSAPYATVSDPSFIDSPLGENETHTYRVNAFDAAGNTSGKSNTATGTTEASSTPPSEPLGPQGVWVP